MVAINLPIFAGMIPAVDKRLLDDKFGQYVENAWLYSGALDALPEKKDIYTLTNPFARAAYRIPVNNDNPAYIYDGTWVEFADADTDFLKAPISDDSFKRFYWTSKTQAPQYNTKARIENGDPAFLLGLPQPGDLNVVPSGGGSATLVSRTYIATLVSEYGEEGPASNPFLVSNAKIDATFTVTLPAVAADDMGVDRNVKKIRLYRTIVSSAGTVTYYLHSEVNALTTTQDVVDNMSDDTLSSKTILESTAWTAPPHLYGFTVMPNGIMAGFRENELWFSEPYRPHAWPASYSLSTEYEIVGLGVVGNTLVICTKGNPFTASGVHPSTISLTRIATFEPCTAKGSIVATESGCYYTSPNGLILVNAGYAQNITKQFISKDKWHEYTIEAKVNAGRFGTAYFAYSASVSSSFDTAFQEDMVQQDDGEGDTTGFYIDPENQNISFIRLADTEIVRSIKNDPWSSEMYMIRNGIIQWMDFRPGYERASYKWKSKTFQTGIIKNFSAYKLWFDASGDVPTGEQNFDIDQDFDPDNQYGVVRIYANGEVILCHEFRTPGELMRMPSGFKVDYWEIEIEARVRVPKFQMATSVKELQVA